MESGLEEQIRLLPQEPGIYRFHDRNQKLIYVGKARDLRKRVQSYFSRAVGHSRKTLKLVSEIRHLEYTITPTEFDALLLENTYIKQYQPKYNFLLKDDKTYPYLCILNEPFPRIISTRKYEESKGEYFGPYASASAMYNVLDLVRRLYTLRTCSLHLSPENITAGKFRICLEYHIGNCKGPCEGLISAEAYKEDLQSARKILRGKLSEVHVHYKNETQEAANRMEFEKAEQFRRRLDMLEKFQTKNTVVNRDLSDLDVVTINCQPDRAWINFMQIREGAIVFSENREIIIRLEEEPAEILASVYAARREIAPYQNKDILSNLEFHHHPDQTLTIPRIGDKKRLIELSLTNGETLRKEREQHTGISKTEQLILQSAQNDLRLGRPPAVIECFDNSNLQGTNPVAAMVQFRNGKPYKSNYRRFNIKTVTGPDDFASMHEIITRRYTRLLTENQQLPDLIVVDGGKGQLSSATDALKNLDLLGTIPIIGIAKNLEEIFFPDDSIPLLLNKRSPTLRLIQQMRDEAHRFGLNFHRSKRGKSQLKSQADEIPGIGQETMNKLLRHFRSLRKLRAATAEELTQLVGAHKAKLLAAYFSQKPES